MVAGQTYRNIKHKQSITSLSLLGDVVNQAQQKSLKSISSTLSISTRDVQTRDVHQVIHEAHVTFEDD